MNNSQFEFKLRIAKQRGTSPPERKRAATPGPATRRRRLRRHAPRRVTINPDTCSDSFGKSALASR
jgi:hypothetical protein